jgi:hypothetical protein
MKRPTIDDTISMSGQLTVNGNTVDIFKFSQLQDEYINHLERANGITQLKKLVREFPNDTQLGEAVREYMKKPK